MRDSKLLNDIKNLLNTKKVEESDSIISLYTLFVTLNTELIKYGYEQIDYVIIHELSHFVHFNHSKDFWSLVEKYKKNYKVNRKNLRE